MAPCLVGEHRDQAGQLRRRPARRAGPGRTHSATSRSDSWYTRASRSPAAVNDHPSTYPHASSTRRTRSNWRARDSVRPLDTPLQPLDVPGQPVGPLQRPKVMADVGASGHRVGGGRFGLGHRQPRRAGRRWLRPPRPLSRPSSRSRAADQGRRHLALEAGVVGRVRGRQARPAPPPAGAPGSRRGRATPAAGRA